MNPQDTIDLSREAISMAASVAGPMLIAGLLIGLAVGVMQAMTQIQDQTVSAVPKIVGMMFAGLLALPWISDRMVDYTRETLSRPLVGGVSGGRSTAQLSSPFESNHSASISGAMQGSMAIDQSNTFRNRHDGTVRVASRSSFQPVFQPVFPSAPKLLPAAYPSPTSGTNTARGAIDSKGSLGNSSMPALKFNGNSMPQMLMPTKTNTNDALGPVRLPSFQRPVGQQENLTDIGG